MSEEDVTGSDDSDYHSDKNDKSNTESDTESDSEDTTKACMHKVWKPLNKRPRSPEKLKKEGAGCSENNDVFHFELESSVVVEIIKEKSGNKEGNNNVIATGKSSVHEGICCC